MTPQPERHALADVLASLTRTDDVDVREFWRRVLAPPSEYMSFRDALDPSRRKADGVPRVLEITEEFATIADMPTPAPSFLRRTATQQIRWAATTLWTVATPAEAFERLTTDGVLPLAWAGDTSRAFWCPLCKGKRVAYSALRVGPKPGDTVLASPDPVPCFCCDEVPSIADLVAWSSLGVETIQRAEHLARETASRLRPWGVRPPVVRVTGDNGRVIEREVPRRVVWRVGPRRTVTSAIGTTFEAETPDGWPSVVNSARDSGTTWMWYYDNARRSGIRDVRAWWIAHAASWPADAPPCPYAPVVELLGMGLALDAITNDALVVVVQPLGDVL